MPFDDAERTRAARKQMARYFLLSISKQPGVKRNRPIIEEIMEFYKRKAYSSFSP